MWLSRKEYEELKARVSRIEKLMTDNYYVSVPVEDLDAAPMGYWRIESVRVIEKLIKFLNLQYKFTEATSGFIRGKRETGKFS